MANAKLKTVLNEVKKIIQDTEVASSNLPENETEEIDIEKLKDLVDGFKKKLVHASSPGIIIHPAVYIVAFLLIFSILGTSTSN